MIESMYGIAFGIGVIVIMACLVRVIGDACDEHQRRIDRQIHYLSLRFDRKIEEKTDGIT